MGLFPVCFVGRTRCGRQTLNRSQRGEGKVMGDNDVADPFKFNMSHAFISPDKRPTFGNISNNPAAAFL